MPVIASVTGCSTWMRVEFQEVEREIVGIDKEFGRARAPVSEMAGKRTAASSIAARAASGMAGAGASSTSFETAAGSSNRACRGERGLPVAQQLHFDVAAARHEALDIDRRIAERRLRLGAGHRQRAVEVFGAVHPAHALAATAGNGLQQQGSRFPRHGPARPRRFPPRRRAARAGRLPAPAGARRACRPCPPAWRCPARRSASRLGHGLRERGVLRQETVSGMDRIAPASRADTTRSITR
jgi:hypothetical protein